eukprot:CAMPEP_0196596078 /NCGR_PEP_ID=MMETSP1081-20130531/84052_1 /TAXON_ID=36882 /ORGANISM="Pyramimonas amylifera, Strain CCMP720" /LENGTH=38 /DNA_ID= /DNA_START= /DNA_END= /DNA_ORIENTATION=
MGPRIPEPGRIEDVIGGMLLVDPPPLMKGLVFCPDPAS